MKKLFISAILSLILLPQFYVTAQTIDSYARSPDDATLPVGTTIGFSYVVSDVPTSTLSYMLITNNGIDPQQGECHLYTSGNIVDSDFMEYNVSAEEAYEAHLRMDESGTNCSNESTFVTFDDTWVITEEANIPLGMNEQQIAGLILLITSTGLLIGMFIGLFVRGLYHIFHRRY